MAEITAAATGDWHTGATWVGGVVPANADTVNFDTYTVTVKNGHPTNEIAQIDGGGGGGVTLEAGGVLTLTGIATFDSGESFIAQSDGSNASEVHLKTSDGGNAYVRLNAGSTVQIGTNTTNLVYFHGTDLTHRPSRALFIAGAVTADSYVNGLHVKWVRTAIDMRNGSLREVKNLHAEAGQYGVSLLTCCARVVDSCIHGMSLYALSVQMGTLYGWNLALGEDLGGTGDTNNRDVSLVGGGNAYLTLARLESTTPASVGSHGSVVGVASLGAIVTNGILTGSGTPGTDKAWLYNGTVEKDGSYTLLTPNSNCSSDLPLVVGRHDTWPFYAPIKADGGDTISATATVYLNGSQTADTVELVLDPFDVHGANATSSEDTPQSTETDITAEGTVAAGSYDCAVPWEVRVTDYAAGGTVQVRAFSLS